MLGVQRLSKWLPHSIKFAKRKASYKRRTLAQQELDYIEESNGKITGFECKWNSKAKGGISRAFTTAYPEAETHIIHPENAENYLL